MTVKITLPNNLDNSAIPRFCDPKIRDSGFNTVSFSNWGRFFFPLPGGEVVLTSGPVTTAGDYFLDLSSENHLFIVRVVLVEVKKTGSSEPILKVADIVRGRHQVLLYMDKETEVTFSVDKATTTSIQLYSLDEFLIVNGASSEYLFSSETPITRTASKGFSCLRFSFPVA